MLSTSFMAVVLAAASFATAAVPAERNGQVKVQNYEGTIGGCLAADLTWTVSDNCATYLANKTVVDDNGNWLWYLMNEDGQPCGRTAGKYMECSDDVTGDPGWAFDRHLFDGSPMGERWAENMPDADKDARLLSRPKEEHKRNNKHVGIMSWVKT